MGFANNSSGGNSGPDFLLHKNWFFKKYLILFLKIGLEMIYITMLDSELMNLKSYNLVSEFLPPDMDNLSYEMFKHLNDKCWKVIVKLFNFILE